MHFTPYPEGFKDITDKVVFEVMERLSTSSFTAQAVPLTPAVVVAEERWKKLFVNDFSWKEKKDKNIKKTIKI